MKKTPITFLIGTLGFFLFFLYQFELIPSLLQKCYPNVMWENYFEIIQQLLFSYVSILLICIVLSFYIENIKGIIIINYIKSFFNTNPYSYKKIKKYIIEISSTRTIILLLLISIIGVSVRIFYLRLPITWDEAYTYLNFIDEGFTELFHYKMPNNHQFHTICTKIAIIIFGDNQISLRLPAFLFGSLNITLIFFVVKYISKEASGLLSSVLLSCLPAIIYYDTIARGYSMITTFSLLLLLLSYNFIRTKSLHSLICIVIISSIGFFTIPTFFFPLLGTLFWLSFQLFRSKEISRNKIIFSLLGIIFGIIFCTLILYSPTIIFSNGIDKIIYNRFINGDYFAIFPDELPYFFINTLDFFFSGYGVLMLLIIVVLIFLSYKFNFHKKYSEFILFQLSAIILVILCKETIPPSRVLLFIMPYLIVGIDIYISALLKQKQINYLSYTLPCLQLISIFMILSKGTMLSFNGFLEVPDVIDYLKKTPLDSKIVCTNWEHHQTLKYYLQINNMQYPYFIDVSEFSLEEYLNKEVNSSGTFIISEQGQKINISNNSYIKVFEKGKIKINRLLIE